METARHLTLTLAGHCPLLDCTPAGLETRWRQRRRTIALPFCYLARWLLSTLVLRVPNGCFHSS